MPQWLRGVSSQLLLCMRNSNSTLVLHFITITFCSLIFLQDDRGGTTVVRKVWTQNSFIYMVLCSHSLIQTCICLFLSFMLASNKFNVLLTVFIFKPGLIASKTENNMSLSKTACNVVDPKY